MTQQEFTSRYQFSIKTDKIGGGSFGTVYKAYDNVLDREVAIKVSEVKYVGDKEFSLLEEYKAIENVPVNKYIANYDEVYRFESFQGIFDYGLMQYYALGNLSHYLKNNTVSQEKRESLVLGILEGIGFLHKHKVVHRDLKPSNILVVDRKGELIPKITDFGLSKQASADTKASRFTNSFAGGTLQYSSPEQIKGLPLKLNTDLWSFGTIAYEILTGKTLFETDSNSTATAEWQNAITQKILHEDVSIQLQSLPLNWQKALSACLERDLTKRVQNTTVLVALLNNESTAQESKQPVPPVIPNDDPTVFKEKPTLKEEEPKTKSTPKKNKSKWLLPIASAVVIGLGVAGYFGFKSPSAETINLQTFEEGGLYGYKLNDSIVIPAQYIEAGNFIDIKAKVTTKDSTFYIDENRKWIASVALDKNKEDTETPPPIAEENTVEEENALADNKAWQKAKITNNIDAYKKYKRDFPSGTYYSQATSKINAIAKTIAADNERRRKEQKENKDSDGDGIKDKYDNCPNVYGVASNNGCPKKKRGETIRKGNYEREQERKALQKKETVKDIVINLRIDWNWLQPSQQTIGARSVYVVGGISVYRNEVLDKLFIIENLIDEEATKLNGYQIYCWKILDINGHYISNNKFFTQPEMQKFMNLYYKTVYTK